MSITLKPHSVIKARIKVTNKGPAHKFLTATIAKAMDKYVPFDTGTLAETVIVGGQPTANVTENTITYTQKYAGYQYYGQRRDGTHVIRHNKTDKHSYAGPYWDKRMISAEGERIVRDVQKFIERGGY